MIWEAFERGALEAAPLLLGCTLRHGKTAGIIIETEAYTEDEAASHTFKGPNLRNRSMYKQAGHAYVYLSYGIHSCINVVCGPEGRGEGVLIRSLQPIEGIELMRERRGTTDTLLTNGPGKLTQALGIGLKLDGHDLRLEPLTLTEGAPLPYLVTPRVGISKATELHWRFVASETIENPEKVKQ